MVAFHNELMECCRASLSEVSTKRALFVEGMGEAIPAAKSQRVNGGPMLSVRSWVQPYGQGRPSQERGVT